MGCSKSSANREVYSNTILSQIRKISNRQPNFTPVATGKRRRQENPKLVETKKS